MVRRTIAIAAALLLTVLTGPLIGTALAQETRVADKDEPSPPATIAQMDWLVGQWSGTGIGGAPAQESWLPAVGGTMVGTFVQEDGASGIQFTEHMYLMEEEGSLVLKLKHFNADLTGWEDKEGMVTFRLVGIEECAAYFNALTLRCDGDDGLLAAVRMQTKDDSISELVFRFTRTSAKQAGYDCDGTTHAMNQCMAAILGRAKERQQAYLTAALERQADRPNLIEEIGASDRAFALYREAECGAVYEDWKEGTIRNFMSLACSIQLTDRRTHTIWRNWLSYSDSTPSDLPEPSSSK